MNERTENSKSDVSFLKFRGKRVSNVIVHIANGRCGGILAIVAHPPGDSVGNNG